jgi:hypothetical protein
MGLKEMRHDAYTIQYTNEFCTRAFNILYAYQSLCNAFQGSHHQPQQMTERLKRKL